MALVKRTQIYLDEDLDADRRAAAAREGRSAAALIREAIKRYLSGSDETDDPILALIGKFQGTYPDASVNHDLYLYRLDPD